MENGIEKYMSRDLTTIEGQIANAHETHPDEWKKEIHPGNYIVDVQWHDPYCYRIISIEPVKDTKIEFKDKQRVEVELDTYHLDVKAVRFNPFTGEECQVGDGFGHEYKSEIKALSLDRNEDGRKYFVFNDKDELLEYINGATNAIMGKDTDFLKKYDIDDNEDDDNSTALVSMSSKMTYVNAEKSTLALKEELDRRLAIVKMSIAEQQAKFDIIRRDCEKAIAIVQRKITRIQRVLGQIELYLGVNEDIVQIQEGMPAPIDTPIHFFQDVLYMDEEVGDWRDGGLDFSKIEQFDEWLLRDNHIDLFLPEKGIRVFRPRRYGKRGKDIRIGNHFVHNPYFRNELDMEDKQTYIIIRNGDNVYRIWADLIIYPYLFPKQDELQKLINELEESGTHYWASSKKEQIEDFIDRYKFNFCLLQGLLDRSDVLAPHNPVNLFKDGLDSPYVEFIYDAGVKKLTDGHPSYWEFVKEVNKDIKVGTRVLFLENYVAGTQERFDDRFYSWKRNRDDDWGLPIRPSTGVYNIEKNSVGEFVIKYMPSKESDWCREIERKNRIAFKVYTDEREVLNYDALDLETVEYYLNNRVNRTDYLDVMPMLEQVHEQLIKETEMEKSFILLIKGQAPGASDELINETIKWWKLKNKVKRPITANDALAYKQILAKVNKFLN